MNTLQKLQSIMPGQPIAWYKRIAAEIDAGRMPMPHLTPEQPKVTPPPVLVEVEVIEEIQSAIVESIPEPELLPPVLPPSPSVYSFTKEELAKPADDIKAPTKHIPRKTKKKAQKQQERERKAKQRKTEPPKQERVQKAEQLKTELPKQEKAASKGPSKSSRVPKDNAPIFSRHLLTLCRNDYKLASRLVHHQLALNPDRDFKWAQEKAIWDLERDRR